MTISNQANESEAAQALAEYLSDNCGTQIGVEDVLSGLAFLGLELTRKTPHSTSSSQTHHAVMKSEPSDSVMLSELEAEDELDLET